MIFGSGDAFRAFVAGYSDSMKEWRREICRTPGVDAVAFDAARRVDIIAVMVIDCHVGHTAGVGIAEEQQVAGLTRRPVGGLDACACKRLLRSVAHQYYTVRQIADLSQARTVEALY